ncbi:hypothetical protein [Coxiella-like endosymbiont]|nr:hypothetical protein [Coxiella-like endosymbiont]
MTYHGDNVGPFSGYMAALLGLGWLACLIYANTVVSSLESGWFM